MRSCHIERQLSGLRCFWPGPEDARRVVGRSSFFSSCTVQYPTHVLACSLDFQPTDIACRKKNIGALLKEKENAAAWLPTNPLTVSAAWSASGLVPYARPLQICAAMTSTWMGVLSAAAQRSEPQRLSTHLRILFHKPTQTVLPPAISPSELSPFPYLPSVQLLSHSCEVAQTSVDQRWLSYRIRSYSQLTH